MIPKQIHYVWIKGSKNYKIDEESKRSTDFYVTLPKEYEICILSAYVMNPEYKIILHTNAPLKSDLLLQIPTLENRLIDEHFFEETTKIGIGNVAHLSDYIRYSILNSEGGLYFDTDIICIKPCDSLLNLGGLVLAREKPTTVCCAAMLTEPNNSVLKETIAEYHVNYIPNEWLYNSQKVLLNNTKRFPEEVTILDYETGFFYPNWKPYPMGMFYDPHPINRFEDIETKFKGYSHHLWGSTPYGDRLKAYIRDVCLPNIETPNETYISQLLSYVYKRFQELTERTHL